MTIADHSESVAFAASALSPLSERRADERVQTVFRVARVITATDEGLARIRNMSNLGARVRMLIPLPLADMLILQLADGVELGGQVVWKEGNEFGLQFDQPIDCAALLGDLATGSRSGRTRPVRLPLTTLAVIRSERGLRCAKVVDISQRGLKLVHDGSLTEGLQIEVSLPSGIDRRGIVRWTKPNLAGIMLLDPLSVEALGSAQGLIYPSAPLLWSPHLSEASSPS